MEYFRVNIQTEAERKTNLLRHIQKKCKGIRGIREVLKHIVVQSHVEKKENEAETIFEVIIAKDFQNC